MNKILVILLVMLLLILPIFANEISEETNEIKANGKVETVSSPNTFGKNVKYNSDIQRNNCESIDNVLKVCKNAVFLETIHFSLYSE